jgi:hypothetical protein
LAGAILAGPKYANVFEFDTPQLAKFAQSLVRYARAIIDSNQNTAEDILNAYTREYNGQFIKIGPEQNGVAIFNDGRQVRKDSTRGRVAGRIEYDVKAGWVDYYIEVALLKRYCATRNWSYKELVARLNDTMVTTEKRKNLLAKTNGPDMNVKCLQISRPIDEIEKDDVS